MDCLRGLSPIAVTIQEKGPARLKVPVASAPEKIEGVYHNETLHTEWWKAKKSKVGHFEEFAFREKRNCVNPFLQRPVITQLPVAATNNPRKKQANKSGPFAFLAICE
jgi:hypothetical protein